MNNKTRSINNNNIYVAKYHACYFILLIACQFRIFGVTSFPTQVAQNERVGILWVVILRCSRAFDGKRPSTLSRIIEELFLIKSNHYYLERTSSLGVPIRQRIGKI